MIDTNKIPENVKEIMQALLNNNYEAYMVGGCVRDMLLHREPKDYDLTTNAHPDVVESLFEKTIPTGKEYGTITVMMDGEGYEITTYRLECDYDGRRPKAVKFAKTLEEDLSRRDFTINAMACDIDGNIVDPYNGIMALKRGYIDCVGDARERFKEDKLRGLRAIRFRAQYNFGITDSTWLALEELDITSLSGERVRDEFNKILVCENVGLYLAYMYEYNLLGQIIPEIIPCYRFNQNNPHHDDDVLNHIFTVVQNTEPILELRLAALFHDIGKPNTYSEDENGIGHFYQHHKESARICREAMTRLKYSNEQIEHVSELVYHHMTRYDHLRPKSAKKFINKVGVDKLDNLFKLFIADRCASNPPYDFEEIYKLKFMCEKIINEKQPLTVKDLAVNGYDMINIGLRSVEIGHMLNYLLDLVLEDEELNTREVLMFKAMERIEDYGVNFDRKVLDND